MTPINSSHTAFKQNVTFKANAENVEKPVPKSVRNTAIAVLSYVVPGTGQILNGDTKTGLKHLCLDLGFMAAGLVLGVKKVYPVFKQNAQIAKNVVKKMGFVKAISSLEYFKARFNGVSKQTVVSALVIWALSIPNSLASSISAYKSKKTDKKI